MPLHQVASSVLPRAAASWHDATKIRRAACVLGALGVICGVAAMCAGPALAGVGSQPGNLMFHPGNGALSLTPTWSTTDGCPTGYRGSAQIAIFKSDGTFISLISNVAYGVTNSFGGTLDGSLQAILRYANVPDGGSLEFAVGCDTQIGGGGSTQWMQSTLVTLSSDGKSYTTSAPTGPQVTAKGPGANGTNSGGGAASNAAAAGGGGGGGTALAAWLGGGSALVIAIAAVIWIRRRQDRSRLM